MAGRKRSIRYKIFAILLVPLTAVVVIWGFAAAITVQSGLELLRVSTVYDNVVTPTRNLLAEVARERFLSAVHLADVTAPRSQIDLQRQETDVAVIALKRVVNNAKDESPPAMWERVQELLRQLDKMDAIRGQVDSRDLTPLASIEQYNGVSEVALQIFDRMVLSPDVDLMQQTKATLFIGRSREIVSQQAALIVGAVAQKRMSPEERNAFSELIGKRRLLFQLGTSQLDSELIKPYSNLTSSLLYTSFVAIENEITERVHANQPLPQDANRWAANAETVQITIIDMDEATNKTLSARATLLAKDILLRIVLVGVLGLVALAMTGFISLRFARKLTGELKDLQGAARELADERLPALVTKLRRGDDVDVAAETPPPVVKNGDTAEVENLSDAFTSVQTTAIEAAVDQAKLRKGVNKVFLNLARRSQSLLQRQLAMLDNLEQQVTDPEVLDQLFGVDHLTTRMRRHAEGLIILSGSAPGRGWRNPVSLYDVVRAAVEEVEDYLRVSVTVPHGTALIGAAVTDLVHLMAELVENATIFSPPHTQVYVRGEIVARGFVLEVEDRGLGISHEEMAQLNDRLANPPEFDLADSDRLGLFVVGLLAKRHGIKVSLRTSPYGGTAAIVLIPQELVVQKDQPDYSVEQLVAAQPTAPALELTRPASPYAPTYEDFEDLEPALGEFVPSADSDPQLPKRVRQASLAPQLRMDPADVTVVEDDVHDAPIGDQRTDLLSSFQAGWRRGEADS